MIVRFWLPVIFWAGVIFSFSSLSVRPTAEIYWQDFIVKKTAHIIEFSVLFVLLYRAFLNTTNFNRLNSAKLAFLLTVIYAISDEYHQSFTPGREPTLRDIIIDVSAAALAWTAVWKYLPKAPKKLKSLGKILQII